MNNPRPALFRPHLWTALFLPLLAACQSTGSAENAPSLGSAEPSVHLGPPVDTTPSGPARFLNELSSRFDVDAAMDTVAFGDGFYRVRGSDGYNAVLDHIEGKLKAAGFGTADNLLLERVTLEEDFTCWTPKRGRISLQAGVGMETLHRFDRESDVDRLLLPIGAPACDVTGPVVFRMRNVTPGTILVTAAPPQSDVLHRAAQAGAVAVLSSSLASYNVLPDTMQHPENALRLRRHPKGEDLPAVMISRASHRRIEAAHRKYGSAEIQVQAETTVQQGPLQMLVATIQGASQPGQAVVLASHVGYAGASDNASGFGATLEGARLLAEGIQDGSMPTPKRSLVFLWGPEVDQSRVWLQRADKQAIAAITTIACGDASAANGSPQYLERMPDPGAMVTLAPDEHTQWGSDKVDPSTFLPNGLALVARCALSDVAQTSNGWRTADHPWEGGSDPDAFQEEGIPAVLFWHFSTSWYHTSLDRLDRIDSAELKRSAITSLSAALAMASPSPEDLERYLRSVDLEEGVRVRAALNAGDEELAEHWEEWFVGARKWLGDLCQG